MHKSDLSYFKNRLLERKKQLLKNHKNFERDLEKMSDHRINDDLDYANAKNAGILEQSISSNNKKEMEYLEDALSKLERGVYGICEMCDEPISIQRLKAKPCARYCITCRQIAEKEGTI